MPCIVWQPKPSPAVYLSQPAETSLQTCQSALAGKSTPEEGVPKCFAYVQSSDTKPKRRSFELMKSQGLQANQQATFLSNGADEGPAPALRAICKYHNLSYVA
jgi:hypothetical protein